MHFHPNWRAAGSYPQRSFAIFVNSVGASAVRRVRTLFVLVGYRGDVNRALSQLRRKFADKEYDFLAQTYPEIWTKRQNYIKAIGDRVIKYIFGETATNFCRSQHLPCAADNAGETRRNNTLCKLSHQNLACHRARPGMLVFVVHPAVFEQTFQRFGRAALLVNYDAASLDDVGSLVSFIHSKSPHIESVRIFLANLRNSVLAPRIPKRNFQDAVNQCIARDAQSDLGCFAEVMNSYHVTLYDSSFQNPRRKETRGAYVFDDRIRFQRDRLHRTAQIGNESRRDVFHLINAFHLYGFAVEPGFHFDVMSVGGDRLNRIFQDILTGQSSSPGDKHVNVSPCDRLL